ncbi:DNA-binding transcriptional regulator YdaS (Cro superfamily) OS=Sphingobium scionense OX=1404341 GN=GGQ90_002892 PE=4 SV=1 [Sphingobium scionense]
MVVTAPRIAEALGSQSALARLCGVSQQSVSKWVLRNKELPAEHVLAVEHATGISRHDLRPDIYPREASAAAGDDRIEGVRP